MKLFLLCPFPRRQMCSFRIHRVRAKKKGVLNFLFYRSEVQYFMLKVE